MLLSEVRKHCVYPTWFICSEDFIVNVCVCGSYIRLNYLLNSCYYVCQEINKRFQNKSSVIQLDIKHCCNKTTAVLLL